VNVFEQCDQGSSDTLLSIAVFYLIEDGTLEWGNTARKIRKSAKL